MTWKTKPSDRFILKFIKTRLSAPISRALVRVAPGVPPIAITVAGTCIGIAGGIVFGSGHAVTGALLAAAAQIVDGVDGQVARLTNRMTVKGAFLDSVLDRFVDVVSERGRYPTVYGRVVLAAALAHAAHITGFPERLEEARYAARSALADPRLKPYPASLAWGALALVAVQTGNESLAQECYKALSSLNGGAAT